MCLLICLVMFGYNGEFGVMIGLCFGLRFGYVRVMFGLCLGFVWLCRAMFGLCLDMVGLC